MSDRGTETPRDSNLRWAWRQLEEALRELNFGSVTLVVQDGVVVQVDRIDRRRFQRAPAERAAVTS